MRSTPDRIRHTISFELIGLALVTPLGAWAFNMPMEHIGILSVIASLVATGWNYVYNLMFDTVLQRLRGTTAKTLAQRVAHAVLFETGLMAMLLPLTAFYLQISLWQALVMDIAFSLFYMVYAFVFNLAYDRLFPLPEWSEAAR